MSEQRLTDGYAGIPSWYLLSQWKWCFLYTDSVIHVTNPADGSVQRLTQQRVVTSSPPGDASAQPVLHPAGLAAKQRPEVRRQTCIDKQEEVLSDGGLSVKFPFAFRLKQVLNDLILQQQQQQPPPSAAGWQTQKRTSAQESGPGSSASPGIFLPFTSTTHPSGGNLANSALSPFCPGMAFTLTSFGVYLACRNNQLIN